MLDQPLPVVQILLLIGSAAWGRGMGMSSKETAIEVIRKLPEDVSFENILAVLEKEYLRSMPAEQLDWSADELSENEWRQFVAYGLRDELSDPREDIYTLEDGKPEDGQG